MEKNIVQESVYGKCEPLNNIVLASLDLTLEGIHTMPALQ